MTYPAEQIEKLKLHSDSLSAVTEGGATYFLLENLRLPEGCNPPRCDALLCPTPKDGYPSRLYFSAQVGCGFPRNWNCANARIAERNWFAFSWRVDDPTLTLQELLVAHLAGFAKAG
jgi:hypothetical protein